MPFANSMGQNYEDHSTNTTPIHPHNNAWKQAVFSHFFAKEELLRELRTLAQGHTLGGGPAV